MTSFKQSTAANQPKSKEEEEEEEEKKRKAEQLDDDAVVDVKAERKETKTDEILAALDRDLIGLDMVKTRVREIADLLVIDRLRRKFGIESRRPTLHMSFTGNPGTGKTTMALRMGELLNSLGYLSKGHLTHVTRDDLVGQYIGHTAPKTKEVLKRARGGVLFIDEAYYLYRKENERDYGQETIEMLLQIMENDRENLVVILAGYKDKMDDFYTSNPGMGSRIAHHIDFPDFDVDELMEIAKIMIREEHYTFSDEADGAFREYIERRIEQPRFSNARSVRNALERARLRQASRVVNEMDEVGKEELMRIDAEDILQSRVFSDQDEGMYGQGVVGEGSKSQKSKDDAGDGNGGADSDDD